jgi:oxygen-independent coproporphyrinogen-3 oxidase
MNSTTQPGIYVHIPFCQHKCGYCDFYSETDLNHIETFLTALLLEIKYFGSQIPKSTIFDSLYIGGGTPSLLQAQQLNTILSQLHRVFNFAYDSEVTLEINPGTTDYTKLIQYKHSGCTRLSIGVQSFRDAELHMLERIHTAEEARMCILDAREAGFDSINIDLIYGLPGQHLEHWLETLEEAITFGPEHLSVYNLIYEPHTPFYKKMKQGDYKQHDQETEALFFTETNRFLTQAGFIHYEVSNYARTNLNISRHNFKYWHHIPYLSFGPSAHSFWNNKRWSNVRSVTSYIDLLSSGRSPVDFEEYLATPELKDEYIMLRLRTCDGIDLLDYEQRYNEQFEDRYQSIIGQLLDHKYARFSQSNFSLTIKGLLICDEISTKFSSN